MFGQPHNVLVSLMLFGQHWPASYCGQVGTHTKGSRLEIKVYRSFVEQQIECLYAVASRLTMIVTGFQLRLHGQGSTYLVWLWFGLIGLAQGSLHLQLISNLSAHVKQHDLDNRISTRVQEEVRNLQPAVAVINSQASPSFIIEALIEATS